MRSFCHRWVLNLHTDQAKSERNDPSCIINGLKILPISFSIAHDTSGSFSWYSEPDQVKDEIRNAHVDSVPIQNKLAIMRSCGWPLHECVPHICNTDPNTANEIQEQIYSLCGRCDFGIKLFIQDNLTVGVWDLFGLKMPLIEDSNCLT